VNTLKSLVVLAVLGVIGYAVYLGLGGQLNISLAPGDGSDPTQGGGLWKEDSAPMPLEPPQAPLATPNSSATSVATSTTPSKSAAQAGYRQEIKPSAYAPPAAKSTAPTADAKAAHPAQASVSNESPSAYSPATSNKTVANPKTPSAYHTPSASAAVPKSETKSPTVDSLSKLDSEKTAEAMTPFRATMKEMQKHITAGHPEDALLPLSIMHGDEQLSAAERSELLTALDQIAGTVIYSREHLMEPAHIVKPGERLEDIASSYNVTAGLLAKINGISDPAALKPNDKLKVIRGPFSAVVNAKKNELTLFVRSRYAGRFQIQIGPQLPAGQMTVVSRTRNHSQHDNHAWIGLEGQTTTASPSGIVGKTNPTATAAASPANVVVSPRDADDLFDILSQGSTVTIIR